MAQCATLVHPWSNAISFFDVLPKTMFYIYGNKRPRCYGQHQEYITTNRINTDDRLLFSVELADVLAFILWIFVVRGCLFEDIACIAVLESMRKTSFQNASTLYKSCCRTKGIASISPSKFVILVLQKYIVKTVCNKHPLHSCLWCPSVIHLYKLLATLLRDSLC